MFHTWAPVNQSDAGKANCSLVALLSLAAATLIALLSPRLSGFPAPAFFTLLRPGQVASAWHPNPPWVVQPPGVRIPTATTPWSLPYPLPPGPRPPYHMYLQWRWGGVGLGEGGLHPAWMQGQPAGITVQRWTT